MMAAINDLIKQIADSDLRDRIQKEVDKLAKQKKFGLVFEEHLPECTPLYEIPVRRGVKVALKAGDVSDFYQVLKVEDGKAICIKRGETVAVEFPVDDLVTIAEFGESIYPYLKPIDTVCNAPDSDLWHTLIEADNYHALQLLEYLYAGKVDCIYIDPPYNTGARDWKYNNDYVDTADTYRHSKWLSMMQRRLLLAKRLLNPIDSVLIVTIDEKEYLHLGCLLEELFPEARMQMISSVINPTGTQRPDAFNRTDEYIYFLRCGSSSIHPLRISSDEPIEVDWRTFRRQGSDNLRPTRPNQFYAIYVNDEKKTIEKVGEPLPPDVNRESVEKIPGCTAVFPVKDDGTEMMWSTEPAETRRRLSKGYIRVGKYTPDKPQKYILQYLYSGKIQDIETGKATIIGKNIDGSIKAVYNEGREVMPTTQWNNPSHNAQTQGSSLLKKVIGENRFSFPKSVYAVYDCLKYLVVDKPDALVVDFFAGSGTTLHAVNLLNAEDGGRRRCILVTNNEVSDAEAKDLAAQGFKPGDKEWEKLGIARYVTWPRTVCSIEGHDINGNPLKGEYIGSNYPMSKGFRTNAAFFKLGFLEKTPIALGMQLNELLPVLWMKAGCIGKCPELNGGQIPDMLILPKNRFAVLVNEQAFAEFEEALAEHSEIQMVFLATDYEVNYRSMVKNLNVKHTYQLYRDYLDHFRLNGGRN